MTTQLNLTFDPPADLLSRLRANGLPPEVAVSTHTNLRTMVSFNRRSGLRVHAGYAAAPDAVITAIVQWARPWMTRARRQAVSRMLLTFPVHNHAAPTRKPSRRPEAEQPGDAEKLERLRGLHDELNHRHFGGRLSEVPIRLSAKMRRKLGLYEAKANVHGAMIAIGRRHLARGGWKAVTETLLHEMVHQWQDETGRKVDHRAGFWRKAAEVGVGR
ncbi:MAG: SprT-like domain-containing protein [Gemmatimonadota bacterium]